MSTKAEKAYMGRVAELNCVLCELLHRPGTPAEVHHIREGQGGAQRAQDYLTIPLCPSCHRGSRGIHGDHRLLQQAKVDEMDLLSITIEKLNRPPGYRRTTAGRIGDDYDEVNRGEMR